MPDSGRSYTGHEGRGEVAVGEDDLHERLTCLTPSPHMRCVWHACLGRQEGDERPSRTRDTGMHIEVLEHLKVHDTLQQRIDLGISTSSYFAPMPCVFV